MTVLPQIAEICIWHSPLPVSNASIQHLVGPWVFTKMLVVILASLKLFGVLTSNLPSLDDILICAPTKAANTQCHNPDAGSASSTRIFINTRRAPWLPPQRWFTWEWKQTLLWQRSTLNRFHNIQNPISILEKSARLTRAQCYSCLASWFHVQESPPWARSHIMGEVPPVLSPESMEPFIGMHSTPDTVLNLNSLRWWTIPQNICKGIPM